MVFKCPLSALPINYWVSLFLSVSLFLVLSKNWWDSVSLGCGKAPGLLLSAP